MAIYNLTNSIPAVSDIQLGDILDCPYSGSVKQIILPSGKYKLECWGAQGGTYSSYLGGKGGYSSGILTITEKTSVYLYTGGSGSSSSINNGFNGGGTGISNGRGGGGASDIRIGTDSLYARVIVAGGGGGAGVASANANPAGCGGGLYGGDGFYNNTTGSYTTGSNRCGGSASQTAGGITWSLGTQASFGQGGNASGSYSCGGGGGGWYGGGGAYDNDSDSDGRWGGGGSGYVYTSSTASNYPSGCLLNSNHYLTDASTIAGNVSFTSPSGASEIGHTGDGYIRITVILTKPYLINLLKYGNFENQGWIAGSNCSLTFDSSIKKYTNYSLKVSITRTNIGEAYFYQTVNPPMIQNHKYYVCCWIYLPTSSSATGMQVYWPEAEPLMGDMVADTTKINQWQKLSLIATRTNWSSGNQKFRFDIEGSISPNYVYIDGAMLIDLTDCYGEGKEPTKEWCDNNISFFTDGIKRQVITAKYIKINGEWKEI